MTLARRTHLGLFLSFFVGLGCGGAPEPGDEAAPAPAAAPADDAEPGGQPGAAAGEGDAPSSPGEPGKAAARIQVAGRIVDLDAQPLAGRAYRVRDALGNVTDGVSDATGAFTAKHVAIPYDVRVDPSAKPSDGPSVYLGLSTGAPVLRAVNVDPVGGSRAAHTIRVTLKLPACASCAYAISSKSAHGGGGMTGSYFAGTTTLGVDITHRFVPSGSPESVTMHVLVHDTARTWFRHATWTGTVAGNGSSSTGYVTPLPVPIRGSFTVTASAPGYSPAWRRDLEARLRFPNGGVADLGKVGSESLVVRVPDIAGASLMAQLQLVDDASPDPDVYLRAEARTGWLPISTSQVTVNAAALPDVVAPVQGGSASLAGAGLSWKAASPALFAVGVRQLGRPVRVWTEATELSFAELAALGVTFTPGDATFDLIADSGARMATFTHPDPAKRRAFVDSTLEGAVTWQRYPITLTP